MRCDACGTTDPMTTAAGLLPGHDSQCAASASRNAVSSPVGVISGVLTLLACHVATLKVELPISLYAQEASGVYFGGAAARMGEVVVGFAYVEGDHFAGDIFARAEVAFSAAYSLHDTLTEADLPGLEEGTTIPILIDLNGEGGGLIAIKGLTRLKTTPFYLILATEEGVAWTESFVQAIFDAAWQTHVVPE